MVDENGREHKHKYVQDPIQENPVSIRRRRVVDITAEATKDEYSRYSLGIQRL